MGKEGLGVGVSRNLKVRTQLFVASAVESDKGVDSIIGHGVHIGRVMQGN
jgi:hypothetical protein